MFHVNYIRGVKAIVETPVALFSYPQLIERVESELRHLNVALTWHGCRPSSVVMYCQGLEVTRDWHSDVPELYPSITVRVTPR